MPPDRYRRKGKRQRFYARNVVKTTLDADFGRLMLRFRPIGPVPAIPDNSSGADQLRRRSRRHDGAPDAPIWWRWRCLPFSASRYGTSCRTPVRSSHQPRAAGARPPARRRSSPSASSFFQDKTETYEVFGIPGRPQGRVPLDAIATEPVAELEIYRPGGETEVGSAAGYLATRMDPAGPRELEAAGVIDSKFGAVTLLRRVGGPRPPASCLRFSGVDEPKFRISGWTCLGEDLPARRTAIGCMLNRLVLLTAGNDPKLTELFAHAEIRRSDCATSARRPSADWVMGAENPHLRGTLNPPLTRPASAGPHNGGDTRQGTGFHETFAPRAALFRRGVAQLT